MVKQVLQGLGKAALILFGFSLALIMGELIARVLGAPFEGIEFNPGILVQCDRNLGWRGLPDTSIVLDTEGYRHEVTWNSRGMRDEEHSIQKEDGVFRIMMFGDSFLEALQVSNYETSRHILEETLNSAAPTGLKFEVISGGVGGWGPAHELIYFRSEGQLYTPDLLLVFWFPGNDLMDNLPDYYRTSLAGVNCYSPYFVICDGQFDPEPWYSAPGIPPAWKECAAGKKTLTGAFSYLYFHSRLYQRLEPLLTKKRSRISFTSENLLPWLEQGKADEVLNYSYQLTADIYAQLAKEASQAGAKTVLVIVPYKLALYGQIDPSFVELLRKEAPGVENARPTLPNQVFTELMETRGLSVLDLQPYFVAYIKEGGTAPYWEGDNHWNVIGNRIAAETIANWLVDQKLVPLPR